LEKAVFYKIDFGITGVYLYGTIKIFCNGKRI